MTDDDPLARSIRRTSRGAALAVVGVAAGVLTWLSFVAVSGLAWVLQRPGLEYYRQSDLPKHLWRFSMSAGIVIAVAVGIVVVVIGRRGTSA